MPWSVSSSYAHPYALVLASPTPQLLQRAKSDDSIDSATDSDCLQLTHLLRLYTDVGGKSGQVPVSTAAAPQAAAAAALTPSQLHMLKYQLAAFRYISHNMPVPPALQQALLGGDASTGVAQRVVEAAFARTKSGDDRAAMAAAKEAAAKKSAAHAPMADGDDVDPYVELATKVPFNPHRILVPALMPVGLDPVALVQERERRIQNRIAFRIAELESLPANMGTAVAPTSAVDENNSVKHGGVSEDKVKALVELKSLRLLEKQRVLRAELVSGLKRSTTLATAVSRVDYRRVKKPSMREIRLTEKLERQQRMDVEKKSKLKHVERLNQIVQHGRDMRDTRRQLAQKQYKLGRGIIQWHANVEREEQKTQERMTKERIRALKEDDEEAYLKLIDKQKDTRLTHLIQQTGQYLDTLSSLVLEQQADIRSREAAVDVPKLPEGEVEDEEDKVDYFNIAHRIREPVTEQASILSGGKLKDYQIKGLEWMVSLYNNKLNGILADEMGLVGRRAGMDVWTHGEANNVTHHDKWTAMKQGKTIQTISLITYLIEKKNQNGPFLVIVPLSYGIRGREQYHRVLTPITRSLHSTITNWTLEFEKWAPSVVKVVYKGTPNQRRDVQLTQMRNGTFNVLLTTYGMTSL